MSAPGVGVLVSLTYASAIDDPGRFKRSRQVGAHFGMTPKRPPPAARIAAKGGPAMPDLRNVVPADRDIQSGEKDVSGRISKIGDRGGRTALYEAAHIIPTRPAGALKSWGMRLAAHASKNKAKVALARKLAAASTHQPAPPPAPHAGRWYPVRY